MKKDDREIGELFTAEVDFIDKGGYGRRVKTPWKPTSVFQDSLTCLNFGHQTKVHPCSECHLIEFVPAELRDESVPCHHIPLNDVGETIVDLEGQGNQQKLEESVKVWLRTKIKALKEENAALLAQNDGRPPIDWFKGGEHSSFELSCLSIKPTLHPPKPRILYVDDDASNSFTLSTLLRRENYNPVTVNFTSDALHFAQCEDFDLFLLSRRFPVSPGVYLCQQLNEIAPKVPIVFLSGEKESTGQPAQITSGSDEYLASTKDSRDILDAVRHALSERRVSAMVQ